MNSGLGTESALEGSSRVAARTLAAHPLIAIGALASIAITGATAVPTRGTVVAAPMLAASSTPAPRSAPQAVPAPANAAAADQAVRRFTGKVGSDFSQSLLRAGVPERQAREYIALLGRAVPLANAITVDDRFDLVIEKRPDGSLDRLLYAGLDRVARADVELLKWTDGKQVIWVNADGVGGGEASEAMRMPVAGRVSSGFGERFHPILGYARMHNGVDLAAPAGTPIVAAADGRIVSAGSHGGYGRAVSIAHAAGMETTYGHMSRIAAYAGELVHRGQVIGYVGSTGLSTGPHLHFEVTRNGRAVNPLSVKMGAGPARMEGAKLHAFQDELRAVLLVPAQG